MLRFRTFLEFYGEASYQVPDDRKQQIYDFYMLNMLSGRSHFDKPITKAIQSGIPIGLHRGFTPSLDDDRIGKKPEQHTLEDKIDVALEEMSKTLLSHLKTQLLKEILFAITSEIRHVIDMNPDAKKLLKKVQSSEEEREAEKLNPEEIAYLREYLIKWASKGNKILKQLSSDQQRRMRGEKDSYRDSYNAFLEAKIPRTDFIILCKKLFNMELWAGAYGGKPWANICQGWLDLQKATQNNQLFIQIDHVYDLIHNTNTVFNKLKDYFKGGYDWIKQTLDFKAKIKSPYELLPFVSPAMKKIALPAIRIKFHDTLESYEKRNQIGKILETINTELQIPEVFSKKDKLSKGGRIVLFIQKKLGLKFNEIYSEIISKDENLRNLLSKNEYESAYNKESNIEKYFSREPPNNIYFDFKAANQFFKNAPSINLFDKEDYIISLFVKATSPYASQIATVRMLTGFNDLAIKNIVAYIHLLAHKNNKCFCTNKQVTNNTTGPKSQTDETDKIAELFHSLQYSNLLPFRRIARIIHVGKIKLDDKMMQFCLNLLKTDNNQFEIEKDQLHIENEFILINKISLGLRSLPSISGNTMIYSPNIVKQSMPILNYFGSTTKAEVMKMIHENTISSGINIVFPVKRFRELEHLGLLECKSFVQLFHSNMHINNTCKCGAQVGA